ncbi:potassium-transporting ATPase subunit KdpA, partial [Mycobacterium tuberculosis]|uniref:potassium-transporting ATPase subunit KdpA n=2 Tax=Actinomycetes TaxID=1760 RepID=UPI000A643E60
LAGSFAAQERVPATTGTLPTHRPQFVGLLLTVTVVVTALTYFPVLALGPLAEGL